MAWGIWNKIKKGFNKAINWVGHHIGDVADVASDFVDAFAPDATPVTHAIDTAAHAVQNAVTHNGHS